MSLNSVVLVGRLTRNPEMKYTASGVPVASFTLAVDRNVKPDESGEKQTDFVPCTAWRQSAEFAANYLTKGALVAVDGRLQVRQYEKDGQKRTFTEVVCERVQALQSKREREAAEQHEDAPDGE